MLQLKRERGETRVYALMLGFRIPTEKGDELIKERTFPQTLRSIMEDLKPEAAYFTDVDGARGRYLIVNMDEASELPAKAEPLFFGMGATIKAQVVMTPETSRELPRV